MICFHQLNWSGSVQHNVNIISAIRLLMCSMFMTILSLIAAVLRYFWEIKMKIWYIILYSRMIWHTHTHMHSLFYSFVMYSDFTFLVVKMLLLCISNWMQKVLITNDLLSIYINFIVFCTSCFGFHAAGTDSTSLCKSLWSILDQIHQHAVWIHASLEEIKH